MIKKITLLTIILTISTSVCATKPVEIKFVARTQDQMQSFYEARGFPEEMLNIIRQHCLITTIIHNVSDDIVWLEMKNWQFSIDGKPITRKSRADWKQFWTQMSIPLPNQATFHWTQIPDELDYLPGEREGGNITLPRTDQPITIRASFATGRDKQGPTYNVEFNDVRCAENKP